MSMRTMLSLAEVKGLMGDESLSDEEAEEIRDACYCFAELVLDAWRNTHAQSTGESDDGAGRKAGGDEARLTAPPAVVA